MNKQIGFYIVLINILFLNYSFSQEPVKKDSTKEVSSLFLEEQPLRVKLSFSIKDIKRNTNDSTYTNSNLSYQLKDSTWQDMAIELRGRGNYRLKNCYFPPLKIKLKKSDAKGTPFEGNKSLKLVLPCLNQNDKNDNIIKEYLAYKIFEILSPYHFKTRFLDITFEEEKGKNMRSHALKGFLVEDDKKVAKRFNGNVYKRSSHPLNHEAVTSVRNALFQYMIGNTDFSQAYQHNMKVIYIDNSMIPLPYDFDMSGFVNTSYAVVSQIPGEEIELTSVTQRKYRGFERDNKIFYQVRNEMISLKDDVILELDNHEKYFDNPKEFKAAKDYILSFFDLIENDKKFRNEILDQRRKE